MTRVSRKIWAAGGTALAVAGLSLTFVACGRPDQGTAQGRNAGGQLTVKGSDTMNLLVSIWAEAFMKEHPDVSVSVTGGGSGTGVKALINGTTDIAMASRDITAEERESARKNGHEPNPVVVARDGVALIVNPQNSLNELTIEQLKKIYMGQNTRWSELGGPDEEIVPMSRESSSGTYLFFQEHVMSKQDYSPKVRPLAATAAIVQGVTSDRGAIGYVGLGYATGAKGKVKIIAIKKDQASPAVMPSEETVKDGSYSIARPLYLISAGQPQGQTKQFIDFALSDAGQEIVRQNDYVTAK